MLYDNLFQKPLPVKRNPAEIGGIKFTEFFINVNKIQRPIPETSEQDMEHLQTTVRV